jgi:hypothetical protein
MMPSKRSNIREIGSPIAPHCVLRGFTTNLSRKDNVLTSKSRDSESGSSLVEMALLLPVLFLLLVGVVDFGRAYYLVLDAPDVPNFTAASVTTSKGCECSDGSSPVADCTVSPSCATNVVNYVQVNTSATYSAIFPYPGIPSPLILRGSARMRAGQ